MTARLWLGLLACAVLGGCAANDEGRVELRRGLPVAVGVSGPSVAPAANTIWCITCEPDQTVGKDTKFAGGVEFAQDDKVSISLKTVYVAAFSEWSVWGEDVPVQLVKSLRTKTLEANGEIAVAATVIDATREPNVDPDKVDGRIVFYSDDMLQEQPLNQSNLTVYGPVAFKGGPLYVRFSIYEVDADSEQMKKLLSAVANAGKIAFAPASPVLDVLEGIGAAVAQGGSTSDRVFQYTAIFDGGPGSGDVRHLKLLTGDYVLIRSDDREIAPPWDYIYLDPNAQILVWKRDCDENCRLGRSDDRKIGKPFTDSSYIIFTVNKGLPGGPFQFEQTLAEVEERLKASNEGTITAALIDTVSTDLLRNGKYEVASSALDRFASKALPPRTRQEAGIQALTILAESRCARFSSDPLVQAKALTGGMEERIMARMRAATQASLPPPPPPPAAPPADPTALLWPSEIDGFLWTTVPAAGACAGPDLARLKSQAATLSANFQAPAT